jgi:hypothetical protein
MKTLIIITFLFILTSCATALDIKRGKVMDCIQRMRIEAEIPPLKAARICESLYGLNKKDLKNEEDLEN